LKQLKSLNFQLSISEFSKIHSETIEPVIPEEHKIDFNIELARLYIQKFGFKAWSEFYKSALKSDMLSEQTKNYLALID